MGHSIAAKYAARPVARFVHPGSRARERRLGLTAGLSFSPSRGRETELRRPVVATVASLHAGWRGPTANRAIPRDGRPRPAVTMRWTRSDEAGAGRRSRAATAPWHA